MKTNSHVTPLVETIVRPQENYSYKQMVPLAVVMAARANRTLKVNSCSLSDASVTVKTEGITHVYENLQYLPSLEEFARNFINMTPAGLYQLLHRERVLYRSTSKVFSKEQRYGDLRFYANYFGLGLFQHERYKYRKPDGTAINGFILRITEKGRIFILALIKNAKPTAWQIYCSKFK